MSNLGDIDALIGNAARQTVAGIGATVISDYQSGQDLLITYLPSEHSNGSWLFIVMTLGR